VVSNVQTQPTGRDDQCSAKGTLRNILADAGLTVEEFRRLI
jgi:hypothetical protein